jgi:lipid-A-disaccharide synthase
MNKRLKNVFWVAGENSADLHSSMVLKALKDKGCEYRHLGIGGPRMQAQGFTSLFPFTKFSIMGFAEVVRSLPYILDVEKKIRQMFSSDKPDLLVLVDYPGFNLRLAKTAYEMDIPVLYFISPQFWAWRHGRVKKLQENTNFVAAILPFEKELLDMHRVNSAYVGHPIAEEIRIEVDREVFAKTFGLDPGKKWLGFMPGSRDNEIRKMLPAYIKAIGLFPPEEYEFLISKSHTVNTELFHRFIPESLADRIHIVDGYTYEMIKYSQFLVVTSGTATLETAYIGTPFIIAYKSSSISYSIAKQLVRIKRIGLPNIILEEDVVPELIQQQVSGNNIYRTIQSFLQDEEKYSALRNSLTRIKELLSEKSASQEVAAIIERLIEESSSVKG